MNRPKPDTERNFDKKLGFFIIFVGLLEAFIVATIFEENTIFWIIAGIVTCALGGLCLLITQASAFEYFQRNVKHDLGLAGITTAIFEHELNDDGTVTLTVTILGEELSSLVKKHPAHKSIQEVLYDACMNAYNSPPLDEPSIETISHKWELKTITVEVQTDQIETNEVTHENSN